MKKTGRFLALACVIATSGGCMRGCSSSRPPIHLNPNMDRQEKFLPQEKSDFFYDGAVLRPRVPGTVARGKLVENPLHATGKSPWGSYLQEVPLTVDERLLARGKERFGIYCTPCHGDDGDGDGMLFRRSGVRTANLLEEQFRQMAPGKIYETVTEGKGLMPGYRYPIPRDDRWAIVAWVRKLQAAAPDAEEAKDP